MGRWPPAATFVMPGLDPGIHAPAAPKTWMAGTSPTMTSGEG